jgi:Ca2+-binding RTX toxin-like protein
MEAARLALVALVFLLATAAGGSAAKAPAFARCTYAGGTHTLTINAHEQVVTVIRQGTELRVRANEGTVACRGDRPTATNVDTVNVSSNAEFDLDLRGGPFAPGFTSEPNRTPEIEFRAQFRRTGGLRVLGSNRHDFIVLGDLAGGRHAVNLDPGEPHRDIDVSVFGGFNAVSVIGRGGDDKIKTNGGPEFDGSLLARAAISGGQGDDHLAGGDGRDLIGGGTGNDRIRPNAGRDRVRSQGARDVLRLRDGERDFGRCGPGTDKVVADGIDNLHGCEIR